MKVSTIIKDKFAISKFEANQILGEEAQEFQQAVLSSLEKNIKYIIVDLSGVKFISSWGIGMLIHGLSTTKNRGAEFIVAGIESNILDILKKVKLDSVLKIYSTVEKAMADN